MTLDTTNSAPSVNFSFTITATLKNSDGTSYTGAVNVILTGTNLSGTTTGANSAGTATMVVYFTVAGSYIISASCSVGSATATIQENVSPNTLKMTAPTPTVRFM